MLLTLGTVQSALPVNDMKFDFHGVKTCLHYQTTESWPKKRFSSLEARFDRDPRHGGEGIIFPRTRKTTVTNAVTIAEAAFRPEGKSWWLPHHAVVNPNKPIKVRVVLDAATKHAGTSLKNALLKGPESLTSLVGVPTRFRPFEVAVSADIVKMFHQVLVLLSDASTFRFLWRRPGSSEAVKDYQMQVKIFGTVSSPSACAYAK